MSPWWESLNPAKAQWLNVPSAWHPIAKTLNCFRGIRPISAKYQNETLEAVPLEDAELVSSLVLGTGDRHKVCLDLDMPAALVPSSTPGHFHLYVDHEMPWETYKELLLALSRAGILQQGYVGASIDRGFSALRTPWTKKPKPYVLTRTSMFGREGQMEFPAELQGQIEAWLITPRADRPHVQSAFPMLDADHREFLLTGITPDEWNNLLGAEPNE